LWPGCQHQELKKLQSDVMAEFPQQECNEFQQFFRYLFSAKSCAQGKEVTNPSFKFKIPGK
jgi:hypothetical protein